MESILNLRSNHQKELAWFAKDDELGVFKDLGLENQYATQVLKTINGQYHVWHRSVDNKWLVYVNFPVRTTKFRKAFFTKEIAQKAVYDHVMQRKLYKMIKGYWKRKV